MPIADMSWRPIGASKGGSGGGTGRQGGATGGVTFEGGGGSSNVGAAVGGVSLYVTRLGITRGVTHDGCFMTKILCFLLKVFGMWNELEAARHFTLCLSITPSTRTPATLRLDTTMNQLPLGMAYGSSHIGEKEHDNEEKWEIERDPEAEQDEDDEDELDPY
ncbi:hypothetical protein B0H19DRAFT_1067892 [Mycena capillaripes]|nr:hypothetical protein B0H19DRAFT_1067892 [Mycena capillaripes]